MERLEVLKTYKIFIGGKFPRTESGRYYQPKNSKGEVLGNICLCSRKDVRNAVVAARKSFGGWAGKTAFNRGQILYRMAEMLEGRKAQFIEELVFQGSSLKSAKNEVELSIDRLIYYAGWCDKMSQVLGSVNPVSSSHFNFSVHEPMGVVGLVVDKNSSLLGLVSGIAPIIASGNALVAIASEELPLCSITFAEVLSTSDLPGGVINILTGKQDEMLKTMCEHMDVNAIVYYGSDNDVKTQLQKSVAINLKRTLVYGDEYLNKDSQGLHYISDCCELKTTWHPIENIGGATSSY